uniref:Transposase Tc1-like domain-containing protein n=1 Tax=Oncorhynchus tshawytscha TaxID=74940 RepID=A0AAZ3QRU3_ONCTS
MFSMATTTARGTPGTHNPSISAQTVCNGLREAGLRACRPVVRQVLTRHHQQQRRLWAQTHRRRTGKKCSSLTNRGFVSPGVRVGFAFIVDGMSVTPRPVFWSRNEVEGPSWSGALSQHPRTVMTTSYLNAVRYRKDILLPHVPFL